LNRQDLIEDERFSTPSGRVINSQIRKEITGEEIAKWDSDEILDLFQKECVPCAPLLDRMELLDNEQILANDSILRTKYGSLGEVRQARPAARFAKTPSEIARPAPRLGEHTEDILFEAGYKKDEIQFFLKKNIVIGI